MWFRRGRVRDRARGYRVQKAINNLDRGNAVLRGKVRAMDLERVTINGVSYVGGEKDGVRFGFTERTGGVSREPYASLNLGTHVNDDPDAVAENRRRALAALGAGECTGNLVVPNQVHGDRIVTVSSAEAGSLDAARSAAQEGADAVVCTVPQVPVMLLFADCVPVVLTAPGGFAVAHSGWKGTFARIAGKTAAALMRATGAAPADIHAFIGPHITGDEYEVSEDLLARFAAEFASITANGKRLLNLSAAIEEALEEVGVPKENICDPDLSTMKLNDRFFSYRKERGTTGRHAALAFMG